MPMLTSELCKWWHCAALAMLNQTFVFRTCTMFYWKSIKLVFGKVTEEYIVQN